MAPGAGTAYYRLQCPDNGGLDECAVTAAHARCPTPRDPSRARRRASSHHRGVGRSACAAGRLLGLATAGMVGAPRTRRGPVVFNGCPNGPGARSERGHGAILASVHRLLRRGPGDRGSSARDLRAATAGESSRRCARWAAASRSCRSPTLVSTAPADADGLRTGHHARSRGGATWRAVLREVGCGLLQHGTAADAYVGGGRGVDARPARTACPPKARAVRAPGFRGRWGGPGEPSGARARSPWSSTTRRLGITLQTGVKAVLTQAQRRPVGAVPLNSGGARTPARSGFANALPGHVCGVRAHGAAAHWPGPLVRRLVARRPGPTHTWPTSSTAGYDRRTAKGRGQGHARAHETHAELQRRAADAALRAATRVTLPTHGACPPAVASGAEHQNRPAHWCLRTWPGSCSAWSRRAAPAPLRRGLPRGTENAAGHRRRL